ncbi:MAG: hypothetical protein AAF772_03820 [Acidobacteriota bacterium]
MTALPAAFRTFLLRSLTLAVGVALLAAVPMQRLGNDALRALAAAAVLAWLASLVGAVPVLLARGRRMPEAFPNAMGSIVLRLAALLTFAVAAAFSGWFPAAPLLLSMVGIHAALLVVDTLFTHRMLRPLDPASPTSAEDR